MPLLSPLYRFLTGFPASRGLSRRGKNERRERDFLSFLPRRERPLKQGIDGYAVFGFGRIFLRFCGFE